MCISERTFWVSEKGYGGHRDGWECAYLVQCQQSQDSGWEAMRRAVRAGGGGRRFLAMGPLREAWGKDWKLEGEVWCLQHPGTVEGWLFGAQFLGVLSHFLGYSLWRTSPSALPAPAQG